MGKSGSLREEYPRRVARARELMAEQGMDALLLFTGPNLAYFNGANKFLGGRSGSRPFVYLLPRTGEPTLILHQGRQPEARVLTDIRDILTYTRLSLLPLDVVLKASDDHNLRSGTIGVEMDQEMFLDLPFLEFTHLQEALPDVRWVDASPLLWRMRMVKSTGEIARMSRACEITGEAFAKTFEAIQPGMKEFEIEGLMLSHMLTLGGEVPWVMITSGEGNYDLVSKGGGRREVESGDMVWMDCGCSVDGYWSDFSRAGVAGGPSPEQEEAQREIYQITLLGVEMVRSGVPVAEIAARCNAAVDGLGWPVTSDISGLAACVGHGIGLVVTELPTLNEDDPLVLKPGMVVTIEPGVATTFGTFHIEELVLVTEKKPRVLTTPQWELWVF